MTKEYIEQILAYNGIERGCRAWSEYHRGKLAVEAMLAGGGYSEREWSQTIKIIADYCGV
jgi:hypothetical protein